MRLIIDESFASLIFLFVVLMNGFCFLKNGIFTICKTRLQRFVQSIYFTAILFIVSYEIKLLGIMYKRRNVAFETNWTTAEMKFLQYICELILTTVIIFSFSLILESFRNFKIKELKSRVILKYSCTIYGFLRLLWFAYPLLGIMINITNIAFYSFLIEIFSITEFFILAFVFLTLRETIKKLQNEVEICLMNDKTYVQYILEMLNSFSTRFIIASILQCIYRILYLTVFFNNGSKVTLILKDSSVLLKILSVHLILDSINNLIIFNDPSAIAKCEDDANEKFFQFAEDNTKEPNQSTD